MNDELDRIYPILSVHIQTKCIYTRNFQVWYYDCCPWLTTCRYLKKLFCCPWLLFQYVTRLSLKLVVCEGFDVSSLYYSQKYIHFLQHIFSAHWAFCILVTGKLMSLFAIKFNTSESNKGVCKIRDI